MKKMSPSAIPIVKEIGSKYKFVFFDRDGVINKLLPGQYVTSIAEFQILPDVIQVIGKIQQLVSKTFIVTNQQGIGKGIMTVDQLNLIHQHLQSELIQTSGKPIDKIYFAPQLQMENSPFRKPNIGMALKAKEEFPELDFRQSILFGDSKSDYLFAKKAGIQFIRVENMQGWNPDNVPYIRSLSAILPYL